MLSDEEKKALKELTEIKELVEEDLKYKDYEVAATLDQIDLESLVIVLNLIEKQSKEIEKLKAEKDKYYYEWKHLEANMINKIKAKIEEVKDGTFDAKIVLQSLLEKE